MAVALFAVVMIVVYLIVLNAFLNGRLKHRINDVLCLFLLSIITVVFVAFGWKVGLTSIALCFISVGIGRPFARSTARFLYAHLPKRR